MNLPDDEQQRQRPFIARAWIEDENGVRRTMAWGGGGGTQDGVYRGNMGTNMSGSDLAKWKKLKLQVVLRHELRSTFFQLIDTPFPRYEQEPK